jgi:hypothetical protein
MCIYAQYAFRIKGMVYRQAAPPPTLHGIPRSYITQEPEVTDVEQVQRLASEDAKASLEKIRKMSEENKAVWQREREEMHLLHLLREGRDASRARQTSG